MRLKRIGMRILPPIFIDWYRALKYGKPYQGYIWQGIYKKYDDVPVRGSGYEGRRLLHETFVHTESVRKASLQDRFFPIAVMGQHVFLPMLVSIIDRDPVTILDFGGGLGIDFIHLVSSVSGAKHIEYHVVEGRSMCELGSNLFFDEPRVHFHTGLPTDLKKVDIIYICTALQYLKDYAGILADLSRYEPEYFLFVKLAAGEIPTYVTSQRNLPDTVVAHWFVNVVELESLMSTNGYTLIFKSVLEREYDQENFPAAYRLPRHCNLLFRRSPAG
jgi:putative methyltransferase (TIGR04325 family)